MEQTLNIVLRIVHVGSAIALLGGAVFFLVVMLPALRLLDEGLRGSILQLARKRFYRITHPALVLLWITGLYNYTANMKLYNEAPKAIHGILGTKILLALAITIIVFAQSFGILKGCPSRWAKVNVTLGILIIILAAVARSLRLTVT